jgi:hypothetical protein
MLNLREIGIRITVIDERIQKLSRLPDTFLAFVQAKILLLFAYDIVERLELMIQSIELRDSGSGLLVVLTKLRLTLTLLVAAG